MFIHTPSLGLVRAPVRTVQATLRVPFHSVLPICHLNYGELTELKHRYRLLRLYSRYTVRNLLIPLMTAGPKEPTGIQLQQYLKLLVDDLLLLWEKGVRCKTPEYPEGAWTLYGRHRHTATDVKASRDLERAISVA